MKKLLAIVMALVLVFSLSACFGGSENKVQTYVDAHRDELLNTFESSFATSSGMTCTSDITVEGNGFIISININELNDVADDIKTAMQDAYDGMDSTFEGALKDMQTELPELEYFTIRVCEADGDLIATIHAGK